jgi:molecular chaperone DnaK
VDGLQQASMALSQHMQQAASAGAQSAPEAGSSESKAGDDVIDAEFEKKS